MSRAAVFAGATLAGACWTSSTPRTTPIEEDRRAVETKPTGIAAGTIRGNVRNAATGEPITGIAVVLQPANGPGMHGISDDRGEYVFTGLPPGTYTVTYAPARPRQASTHVTVTLTDKEGQRVDLTVALPSPDRGPCCMPYGAPPTRRRIV